jgi:hypothetical protein
MSALDIILLILSAIGVLTLLGVFVITWAIAEGKRGEDGRND